MLIARSVGYRLEVNVAARARTFWIKHFGIANAKECYDQAGAIAYITKELAGDADVIDCNLPKWSSTSNKSAKR